MTTDEQNDSVRDRRRLEIKERQDIYHWGDDPDYQGLPGFIKAENATTLPKDVQFTQEDANKLFHARNKGIFNTLSIKFRGLFQSWENFEDFCKVNEITRINM